MLTEIKIKTSLSDKITDIMRIQVMNGTLATGETLNEKSLSERFGISRGPVRDAIRVLANEGFVTISPSGRSQIAGFSLDDMVDYYNIRYYLESNAIKKLLCELDKDAFKSWLFGIEALLVQFDELFSGNNELYIEADVKIHYEIMRCANRVSLNLWNQLINISRSIMMLNRQYGDSQYLEDTFPDHSIILDAIKSRDENKALLKLKEHFDQGNKNYRAILLRQA